MFSKMGVDIARHEPLLAALGASAAGCAVFSRHGVPLLLLPRDKALAAATVDLYHPQTPAARVAAAALRSICRAGLQGLLPRAGRSGAQNPAATRLGALFSNPCHGVRLIAVRESPAGGGLEIVKAAMAADAAPIRAEHAALSGLAGVPGVPAASAIDARGGAVWFSMPFLANASRGVDVMPLLNAWSGAIEESAAENGLVRDLMPFVDDETRTGLAGVKDRRALVHGDFAPWNWRTGADGGPVCVDWEWARRDGYSGFDLVYSIVQRAILVEKVGADRLFGAVEADLARMGDGAAAFLGQSGLPLATHVKLVAAYRRWRGMV